MLGSLRTEYPGVPLMALTATANEKVVSDAIRVLGMRDAYLYRSSFNRPNLAYEVRKKDGKSIDVPYDTSIHNSTKYKLNYYFLLPRLTNFMNIFFP